MANQLKVAVVGAGLISKAKHLPALNNLVADARIVGICDLDEQQAKRFATEFGAEASFTDPIEMFRTTQPDVVDICTPPKTHAAIALQALDAGAHLIIEKPMCQTLEECDEVIRAAEEAGRKICVAHSDLFYPSFQRARSIVESGGIGEFRGMHIHLSTPVEYITSKPDHWAHTLPGGVIGETGPHVVYMTLAFIPEIESVQVTARKLLDEYPWSPYEDYRVTLSGKHSVATANLVYTGTHWAAEVDLWGSDGMLRADLESQTLIRYRRPDLSPVRVGLSSLAGVGQVVASGAGAVFQRVTKRYVQTHQELMKAFFDALRANGESPVPPSQGRESIRVMNMITQQLKAPR